MADGKGPTGIGGWLLFFIVGLLFLGPLFSFVQTAGLLWQVEYQNPDLTKVNSWQHLKAAALLVWLISSGLSIFCGLSLIRRVGDPKVVPLVNRVIWAGAVGSLIVGFKIPEWTLGIPSTPATPGDLATIISTVITAAFWTTYLSSSVRVQNTYNYKRETVDAMKWSEARSKPSSSRNDPSPVEQNAARVFQAKELDGIYETIFLELESGNFNKGLWAKCYADTSGNEAQARALYI